MAYFSGTSGSMWLGTTTTGATTWTKAAGVTNWSFSSNLGTLDVTTLEDTDRSTIPGIRNASGSCTVLYYQATAADNTGNSASTLIRKMVKERTSATVPGKAAEAEVVRLKLQIDDGSTDKRFFAVDVHITSAQMQMAVGEVLSAQISFEVIGAPIGVTV